MKTFAAAALAACLVASLGATAASADVLYDNTGPGTGVTNAYTYTQGSPYSVADSFVLADASTLTGVDYLGWTEPGDTTTSVDWAILDDSPGAGGATLFSGSAALSATLYGTGFGYYTINNYSFSLGSISLSAGTYWLYLSNGASRGDSYWDESDGASQSYQVGNGSVPSHTFQIQGETGAVPEPSTWALMILGFGGAGVAIRRRRTVLAA